jgi:WD40 repeat protein
VLSGVHQNHLYFVEVKDATVSIWNKDKGDIIAKIGSNCNGHSQVINCVNWSPSDPYLFATASDDHTVRLRGTVNIPTPCLLWNLEMRP